MAERKLTKEKIAKNSILKILKDKGPLTRKQIDAELATKAQNQGKNAEKESIHYPSSNSLKNYLKELVEEKEIKYQGDCYTSNHLKSNVHVFVQIVNPSDSSKRLTVKESIELIKLIVESYKAIKIQRILEVPGNDSFSIIVEMQAENVQIVSTFSADHIESHASLKSKTLQVFDHEI